MPDISSNDEIWTFLSYKANVPPSAEELEVSIDKSTFSLALVPCINLIFCRFSLLTLLDRFHSARQIIFFF